MKKLAMVVAVATAFAAFAQAPEGEARPEGRQRRPPMGERMRLGGGMPMMDPLVRAVMNPRVAEKIGLDEAQKEQLKALATKQGDVRALQEKVRKGMSRQTELLKAEKIDEAAVMAVIDEVFDARKDIAKAQTKRLIAVKSILTPEQVSKALAEMKELRGEGRGRHAGPKERGKARGAEAPAPAPAD